MSSASKMGFAFALGALLSCSAAAPGSGDFPHDSLVVVASESSKLQVEVRTAPTQPPTRGTNSVELTVRDAQSGAAIDGLSVTVVPWMPAMGHGSSVQPTVTAESDGRYLLSNVSLYMPGHWELRTTFSNGVEDSATPAFDIP